MSTQLLFYSNAVPVSSTTHADLYIKTGGDYGFARSVNSVPLTAVEFRRATPEYAVVFAGEGDAIIPVAILGARADHRVSGPRAETVTRRSPLVLPRTASGEPSRIRPCEVVHGLPPELRAIHNTGVERTPDA